MPATRQFARGVSEAFLGLTSGEQRYHMAVSDSQWLGQFIEGGYYKKLNDIIDADPERASGIADLGPTLRQLRNELIKLARSTKE